MIKYSSLGRKMNREFRVSYRHAAIAGISVFLLFIYTLSSRKNEICEFNNNNFDGKESNDLPTIYAITPTYARPEQQAELVRYGEILVIRNAGVSCLSHSFPMTRISHLFRLQKNLFWVIVEDAEETSVLVRNRKFIV